MLASDPRKDPLFQLAFKYKLLLLFLTCSGPSIYFFLFEVKELYFSTLIWTLGIFIFIALKLVFLKESLTYAEKTEQKVSILAVLTFVIVTSITLLLGMLQSTDKTPMLLLGVQIQFLLILIGYIPRKIELENKVLSKRELIAVAAFALIIVGLIFNLLGFAPNVLVVDLILVFWMVLAP